MPHGACLPINPLAPQGTHAPAPPGSSSSSRAAQPACISGSSAVTAAPGAAPAPALPAAAAAAAAAAGCRPGLLALRLRAMLHQACPWRARWGGPERCYTRLRPRALPLHGKRSSDGSHARSEQGGCLARSERGDREVRARGPLLERLGVLQVSSRILRCV